MLGGRGGRSEGMRVVCTDHLVWFCGCRECSSAGRLEDVAHLQYKTSCTWTKKLGKLLVLVHSLCSPFHGRSIAPSKANSPPSAM